MMNRFIYLFLLLGCVASALVGCTDDPDVEPLPPTQGDGRDSWVTIDFCDNSFDEIHITTRATLDNTAESRVMNLFVFIFDSEGNRLYGRFFDHTNRKESTDPKLSTLKEEYWWVEGNADEKRTYGKVHMYAPAVSGGSLYLLANVNADMVNISPEKLRFVHKLSDLENMVATLNQEIVERNGFFPMTGSANSVSISSGDIKDPSDNSKNLKIGLTRLDAKIQVNVRVAKGYMDFTTTEITQGETSSTGSGTTSVTTLHKIEAFVPLSWQVVNLPRSAFVLPHDADVRDKDGKKLLFTTKETKFETRKADSVSYQQKLFEIDPVTHEYKYKYKNGESGEVFTNTITDSTDVHSFSFYMLENRVGARNIIPTTAPDPTNSNDQDRLNEAWGGYHARDIRLKDDGVYQPDEATGDIWKYAPQEGTYLVIKGEIVMALDISNEGKNQQLSADAVYYIHLGNFGSKGIDINGDGQISEDERGNINNYDILRNTSYTYNITIYGVDNIQIEVETKTKENESGATGHVYVAKESIFTFDSHFGRAVISFDVGHLNDVDQLLWYVRTPFGREGAPHVINGVEVPSGLDYRWVEFVINERDNEGNYIKTHAKYDPEKVMDILAFSKYIKEQKHKFDEDKKDGKIDNESDFRREFDQAWFDKFGAGKETSDDGEWYRYRIYLTIFVDEFYYDADPLTGDVRQDLWKDFVNQPNRLMHILCDTDMCKDEASRATGSVVTIRQRSIQTIFNTQKPELKTAWGCETIDETRDLLWYFSRKERYPIKGEDTRYIIIPPDVDNSDVGNYSDGNGLYNTARIWGLVTWVNGAGQFNKKLWSDYVNYDRTSGLRDDDKIETMRYSCMTRNRDENGDNIIDAKEVKWYMAAIRQLGSLYVGDQGLNSEAVLYPYEKQKITRKDTVKGVYPWRSHVVSSTRFSGYPEILWAEEGLSTGSYRQVWGKYATMSVRCVRNLGMEPINETDAQNRLKDGDEKNNMPERAVRVSGPGVDDDDPANDDDEVDEHSVYKFDLTNLNPLSIRYYTSQELEPLNEFAVESRAYWAFETGPMSEKPYTYDELYNLIRLGKSPCPDGYRTPNIREGALMSLHCPLRWQQEMGTDGKLSNIPSRVSTYYSHGLRQSNQDLGDGFGMSSSWFFNGEKTYLDYYNQYQRIRCVRDIRQ